MHGRLRGRRHACCAAALFVVFRQHSVLIPEIDAACRYTRYAT